MGTEATPHMLTVSMVGEFPPAVEAGTDIVLKVRVSCAEGCNLVGKKLRIVNEEDDLLREIDLLHFADEANEAEEAPLRAPTQPGVYTWSIVYPAQGEEPPGHPEATATYQFTVQPHRPSVAVWDIPFPASVNDRVTLKVGVKCSAACRLAGTRVEVYTETGAKVAEGTLGEQPWPESSALYWTEVEFPAPAAEGYWKWTVRVPEPALALPHEAAASGFGFRTARRPEHRVRVEVREKETQAPVQDAYVVLDIYRRYTDVQGVVTLEVPAGRYTLSVWQRGYEPVEQELEVAGDLVLPVDLLTVPYV